MVRFTPIESTETMVCCGQGWSLLLLVVAVAARPLSEDNSAASARILRIGGSGGSSSNSNNNNNNNNGASSSSAGGYSVSFVPLFSLIANFLPKIFSRFGGTVQPSSRSLQDIGMAPLAVKEPCSLLHESRWPHPSECRQFYECQINPNAPPSCHNLLSENKSALHQGGDQTTAGNLNTNKSSCVTVTVIECPSNYVYSDAVKQCVPPDEGHSCHKDNL